MNFFAFRKIDALNLLFEIHWPRNSTNHYLQVDTAVSSTAL